MSKNINKFISLALVGLVAGGALVPAAYAGDHVEGDATHADKQSCKGANGCKSKGSCKSEDGESHDESDKDSCKGKTGCNSK